MKLQIITAMILLSSFSAYAAKEKRAWDRDNNPSKMGYDYISRTFEYTTNFDELPESGSLTTKPWSGDYWPTFKGGVTYRWNQYGSTQNRIGYKIEKNVESFSLDELKKLSPSEKFDLFLGRTDFPLTNYERKRTQVMKTITGAPEYDASFKIPSWEGLCHAWAPATILYESPKDVVVTNSKGLEIPFGASDIKALLTYNLHYNSAKTQFLGGRCNVDLAELKRKFNLGEMSKAEYERISDNGACEDTNAGAFHIVITNQIALKNQGFIADVTRDLEVWNQAVHGFDTRVLKISEGASKKAAKGTVKEVLVSTQMFYTVEIAHSWLETSSVNSTYVKEYQYTLELDKNGDIIGGEWISEDRPDFLWKQEMPEWEGFFAPLEEIYNASIN